MRPGRPGQRPAPRGALDQPLLQQERLDHLFERRALSDSAADRVSSPAGPP
jgi:hypothetical protein